MKEAAALSGAAAARTSELAVAVGVTNPNTRHPMMTAALGATMSALTGGRFALGLGRGFEMRSDMWGVPRVTRAMLEDTAGLLRRLWAGEKIFGHDGPAGRFAYLSLDTRSSRRRRWCWRRSGPRTQELAGRAFDAVLLHSHWTDRGGGGVRRARAARRRARRPRPGAVQVWSCLVTACDLPEPVELRHVVRRMTTYMQIPGYGELIVDANGWDRAVLDRLRAHPLLQGRFADATEFSDDELRALRDVYPPEWLRDSNAVGSRGALRAAHPRPVRRRRGRRRSCTPARRARWRRCSRPTPRCGRRPVRRALAGAGPRRRLDHGSHGPSPPAGRGARLA